MAIFNSIKKSVSEESITKYNKIVNIHNELKKYKYTQVALDNIYKNMIEELLSIDKNDFAHLLMKNSRSTGYGFETPFGYFPRFDCMNVDYLINLYNEKKIKNHVFLNNKKLFDEAIDKAEEHIINIKESVIKRKNMSDMNDIKIANVTKSFNKESLIKYVVIDVETTGLKAQSDEIIELTAVRVVDGEPVEYFSSLIKPSKTITAETVEINHITNEMVKDSPGIECVIEDFDEFVKGFNIVGHNIAFDLKFLYCSGSSILDQKGIKIFDTVELARKVFKDRDNYKLENICEENLQIIRDDKHRSLSDAFATYYLFEACIELITSKE